MFANQQGLTRDKLVSHLRVALTKAGINPDIYANHSFRIGAATVAHIKGIEDSTIMTLGRWKSNAYQRYGRIPQEHLAQLSCHSLLQFLLPISKSSTLSQKTKHSV